MDYARKRKPPKINWPPKINLFGVGITPTTYAEATQKIIEAALVGQHTLVSCFSTHALIEASRTSFSRKVATNFDMITPDGQPVRWAMNLLHHTGLEDRVYGPELTLRLCREATKQNLSVYFYGSTEAVIKALQTKLTAQFPRLRIAGAESPPFRNLTPREDTAAVNRINASGADIIFIGLGCPKQDLFAFKHRHDISAVQVCVGAAFDFHAGTQKMAPPWMQKRGLEWLFRLYQEPRRLWPRYLITNSIYIMKLAAAFLKR